MKKQILNVLTMLSLVAAFTVTATVPPVAAQSFNIIKVDVPFDFISGSTEFPAGKYTVQPVSENSAAIWIRSDDGKAVGTLICSSTQVLLPKNETALVFHRYADHYFLSQVWTVGETTGIQIPKSSMERRLQRGIQEGTGASAEASEPAIVTVAAALVAAK